MVPVAVGAEPVDFDVVECTLVATYQDVYVGFPLGGFTLLPTEAAPVMPSTLRTLMATCQSGGNAGGGIGEDFGDVGISPI